MANDENLIPNKERTPSELREITRKGGIASGESRRLTKRLANLTKYTDRLSLTKHKRKLRKLWKLRHKKGVTEGDREDVAEEIRHIIGDIRIIKDCGNDVLNIVAIANSSYLAVSKPEVVIKAQAELWDRREGKSVAKTELTGADGKDLQPSVLIIKDDIKRGGDE